jgi:type II secretory pathway component PulF
MIRSSSWFSSTLFPGSALAEQQATLLAILDGCLRSSVELAPMIRALSHEYPGSYSYKLRRLARLLDQGVPWVDALEQTPDALPEDTVLALRLAQHSGIVHSTMDQLRLESSEELLDRDRAHWRSYLAYWLTVSLMMIVVFSLLSYFIVPTLRQMVAEFDLPNASRNLENVLRYSMLPLFIVFGFTCLGILLNWSESFRLWLLSWLRLPIDSMSRKKGSFLRILANAIEQGRPVSGTLSTLAKYHWDSDFRKKILIARNEIEQGGETWSCLCAVGLLSASEKEVLHGESNEDRAWVLRSLARSLSSHQRYRWGWLQSMVHPLVMVFFGLAVLGISSAVIDGLYSLVWQLANETHWR